MSAPALRIVCTFQSTLSVRRATRPLHTYLSMATFQSTLSVRRATTSLLALYSYQQSFQSTLSVRRATYSCTM